MKDREKIIRYFAATSDDAKDMAIRLLDLADVVDRGRPFAVGPFMSPFAAQIGQTIATHMKTVTVKSEGGYHEAERVRIAFSRDDYDGPIDFGMTLLSVTWDDRYRLIGHRDVLGSLMGLGIDRAVLGDILMQGAGCQIVADSTMAGWIRDNFHKVAMVLSRSKRSRWRRSSRRRKRPRKSVRQWPLFAWMPSGQRALVSPAPRWCRPSMTGARK